MTNSKFPMSKCSIARAAFLWSLASVVGVLAAGTAGGTAFAATFCGNVSVQGTGLPIPDAGVEIIRKDCFLTCTYSVAGSTVTAADGTYRVEDVPAGTYSVLVTAVGFASGHVQGLCYHPTNCRTETSPSLVLGASSVINVNLMLPPETRISGNVRNQTSGEVLPGVWVNYQLWDSNDEERVGRAVQTAADGRFEFTRLRGAQYRVVANGAPLSNQPYTGEVFPGLDCDGTIVPCVGLAHLVLADSQIRDDIDFTLRKGALLSGAVTTTIDGTSYPLTATLYLRWAPSPDIFATVSSSAVSGLYAFPPVLPGNQGSPEEPGEGTHAVCHALRILAPATPLRDAPERCIIATAYHTGLRQCHVLRLRPRRGGRDHASRQDGQGERDRVDARAHEAGRPDQGASRVRWDGVPPGANGHPYGNDALWCGA